MKHLERKAEVTYRWWRDDGKDIPDSHIDKLDEDARDHMGKLKAEGFSSGELNAYIIDSDDVMGRNGTEYSGWWEITVSE